VSVYLDTSVVVALFVESDAFTARARQYVSIAGDGLIVSDFVVAEFASAMARLTRMERLARERAPRCSPIVTLGYRRSAKQLERQLSMLPR
jgi:predicted nucleic acid-binding protein